MNDPKSVNFEPTVFVSIDLKDINSKTTDLILQPYIKLAQKVIRYPTDVVMATHLLLYFTTSVPSAIMLFRNFTWIHGILHTIISFWYVGSYTLMRHQHIHQNGILSRKAPISWFDALFPYITDPLMGHTWNSYYYHHVKHHHVEGNGPDDLSSTIRYQRDSLPDFLHYIGRFYFLIWFDLPLYFLQKRKYSLAFKGSFWETANYIFFILMARSNLRPTLFVYIFPFLLLRLGLMIGNWGQHAFVDDEDPDSDYRSSITLIDVPSNRYCFNDGYHTSHHLNPIRHWRQHPVHFLKEKHRYADEHALVFRNIDYLMISVRLMMKDYAYLAKCLVPMGEQIDMTMEERERLLKKKTRRFTEEEIKAKFGKK
jgi:Fatty acid desaturase